MLAAGAAPAVVGSGILMPIRSLVLPTLEEVVEVATYRGNQLLTIEQITREALRIMHKNMAFIGETNKAFDRLTIRVPQPYTRQQ